MITYDKAKNIIIKAGENHKRTTQMISTASATGHVCAKNIVAPIMVQPFDNSAMDGFALRYEDIATAERSPIILKKTAIIAAGDPITNAEIKDGECMQIMTGAPVPNGATTIVPIELVSIDGDNIKFTQQSKEGLHIRKAGEDFQKGQSVLQLGDKITPQHIMVMATLGIHEIEVFKKPKIAFIATGKELVDDLSQELQSGQIYNSNAPYALAALKEMGIDCQQNITINDNQNEFEAHLKSLMDKDTDIIISSGAVSAGEFDFVKNSLENIGAKILFHKVLIRPGKPILFAQLPNGALYFGLPGNPAASSACLRFFVDPALRAMQSQEEEKPAHAKLMTPFSKKKDFLIFLKAKTENWEDGLLTVDLLGGQSSFMVSPFLQMDCWAVAPEGTQDLKAGDIIDIYPL